MHRWGAANVILAATVVLAGLAGCSSGEDDEGARPAASTTVAAGPTTTPPGAGCPPRDLVPSDGAVPPEGAEDVSEARADVDGDGADDRVLAYRRRDGDRRVAVELAAGGTAAVDASAGEIEGPAPLSLLGGVSLGGDGETIFAVTGAGASVVIVGLFQLVGCALARVVLESGAEVELPVGGGITHGDGIACADQRLVRLSASSADGETFTANETIYRIDGTALVEVGSETATLARAADDEEINAYYTVDCPALENPPGDL